MTEINLIQIGELIATENLSIEDACLRVGSTERAFYHYLESLDKEKSSQLFARAREMRGLKILDKCGKAFEDMSQTDIDNKELWRLKNIIDSGMRLAAMYNKNLGEKGTTVNNNTQINNYHDDFVMKRLQDK